MKGRCTAALLALLLTGCAAGNTYEDVTFPEDEQSILTPVGDWSTHHSYAGAAAVQELTLAEYSSADGLCQIQKKAHYYDVTLDLTQGEPYAVGAAYAEALLAARPDLEELIERYVHDSLNVYWREENVMSEEGFTREEKTEEIRQRLHTVKAGLAERFQAEMNGFASQFSGGDTGFVQDGRLSQDEADLIHLIPDVLRATSCSVITADGSRTASGKRLTARLLEWDLGRGNLMTEGHCVVHFRNGAQSFTSVTTIGTLDVITGVNDDGVFAADLDVGSDAPYDSTDTVSYSYAMREALESCTTAREFGETMNRQAADFPFNHNILITDEKSAYIAENCHTETDGRSLLRDASTPLLDTLEWHAPGCLCAVNAFAAQGQADNMTGTRGNILRWIKYDRLFSGEERLSLERFKELLTSEQVDTEFTEIRGNGLVFLLIADYDTHTLQAAFTGREGLTDMPDFVDLGRF